MRPLGTFKPLSSVRIDIAPRAFIDLPIEVEDRWDELCAEKPRLFDGPILSFVGEDIWRVLLAVRSDEDAALETISAGGQAHGYLEELEANIGGSDSVLPSGALSIADTYIFAAFGWWASGFMTEHVNIDTLLGGRPKLQAIVDRVYAPRPRSCRCRSCLVFLSQVRC